MLLPPYAQCRWSCSWIWLQSLVGPPIPTCYSLLTFSPPAAYPWCLSLCWWVTTCWLLLSQMMIMMRMMVLILIHWSRCYSFLCWTNIYYYRQMSSSCWNPEVLAVVFASVWWNYASDKISLLCCTVITGGICVKTTTSIYISNRAWNNIHQQETTASWYATIIWQYLVSEHTECTQNEIAARNKEQVSKQQRNAHIMMKQQQVDSTRKGKQPSTWKAHILKQHRMKQLLEVKHIYN